MGGYSVAAMKEYKIDSEIILYIVMLIDFKRSMCVTTDPICLPGHL